MEGKFKFTVVVSRGYAFRFKCDQNLRQLRKLTVRSPKMGARLYNPSSEHVLENSFRDMAT